MGKLSFRGYLFSRFYPTREIRENLMHAKICRVHLLSALWLSLTCLQVEHCWCQFTGNWPNDIWLDERQPGLALQHQHRHCDNRYFRILLHLHQCRRTRTGGQFAANWTYKYRKTEYLSRYCYEYCYVSLLSDNVMYSLTVLLSVCLSISLLCIFVSVFILCCTLSTIK